MNRLEKILGALETIPPFPKVARRVLEMVRNPEVGISALADVIRYDEAITANVLKFSNAAYFGMNRKVSSLDEALVVIGHEGLKNVIITSSSAQYFQGEAGHGYHLGEGELWRHSVATAIMARLLVRHLREVDPSTAFTAGLLHDIGKRFLSSYVADDFARIVLQVSRDNAAFVEAEKGVLGIDHAQLGGIILDKWQFSPALVKAVKLHHDPEALRQDPLTALIALSNILVISMGIGIGADGLATKLKGEGLKRFGISQANLDLCMADLVVEMRNAEDLLRL